jgi:hypothetical protein
MTRDAVDNAFASGQRLDVKVADPVNVYWTYVTAWATPDGLVQFRDDIYNKDGLRSSRWHGPPTGSRKKPSTRDCLRLDPGARDLQALQQRIGRAKMAAPVWMRPFCRRMVDQRREQPRSVTRTSLDSPGFLR